ncbi:hypothetical protein B1N87_16435, partial [Listeria monocytogenes]|nr:hypothetical protein [Listeria monocytogenes]
MANKADIITLMKNDTPKYVRTHVDTVDGLEDALKAISEIKNGSVTVGSGATLLQQELTKQNGLVNGNIMMKFE